MDAVERRADGTTDLYLQGLATDGDVHAAVEEQARLRLLILASVVPVAIPRRLLGALGRTGLPDGDGLGRLLAEEVIRLRRRPGDVDFGAPMIDPGIPWDRGIRGQGRFWEDVLEAQGTGLRLHNDYEAFDVRVADDGTAVSARTCNARTACRIAHTSDPYRRLRDAVDATIDFEEGALGGIGLTADRVRNRLVVVAVRGPWSDLPVIQLRRALEHAESQGVDLIVRMIH